MSTVTVSDRTVPHNLEAERALLGSVLLDNGALNFALELLGKEDFLLGSPSPHIRENERDFGEESHH